MALGRQRCRAHLPSFPTHFPTSFLLHIFITLVSFSSYLFIPFHPGFFCCLLPLCFIRCVAFPMASGPAPCPPAPGTSTFWRAYFCGPMAPEVESGARGGGGGIPSGKRGRGPLPGPFPPFGSAPSRAGWTHHVAVMISTIKRGAGFMAGSVLMQMNGPHLHIVAPSAIDRIP